VRRAGDGERARLHDTFVELCRIESPSGRERRCADYVAAQVRALGLDVEEDGAGPAAGSDSGNLLTRLPGTSPRSVLLCAHLDTVPPLAPVQPTLVEAGWENEGEGILGADNKAAVAVVLGVLRHHSAAAQPPPVGIEVVFTVCEEIGLRGSHEFEIGRLQSEYGYVFDHATPIGEIVTSSPTHHRIVADFYGRAAHAGLRPEDGRSAILAAARAIAAMQLGRIDDRTTANVGTIEGGTAGNVVPERCRIEAEVRSLDDARAEALVSEIVDRCNDAAGESDCDLDLDLRRMFKGYRISSGAPHVQVAERALRTCGYEPRPIVTGGGSDANAFVAAGFPCANLANGTERAHQPDERVSVDALEGMLEVVLALVEEAGVAATGELAA
jgi:tripeptide aminopeptidase